MIQCTTAFFLKRGAKCASLASQLWEHVNCEKYPFLVGRLVKGARVETSQAPATTPHVPRVGAPVGITSMIGKLRFQGPIRGCIRRIK